MASSTSTIYNANNKKLNTNKTTMIRSRNQSSSPDDSSSSTTTTVKNKSLEAAIESKPGNGPRRICIRKSETGFGFNVRGQVSEGGPLKLVNGEFYAPLQQVSAVLAGGAAELAGLARGDRILEVNGVNVDGATHKQVVDLIKSGGDFLSLVVISIPSDAEAARINNSMLSENLANSDDSSCNSNDYSERRSLDITIPDYVEMKSARGDKYIAFNVFIGGRYLCCRRYKEFDVFHSLLKREFPDFSFPSIPSKWPFKLSEQQLESRRYGLEFYLERICSVKVIFDTDIVKDFLCLNNNNKFSVNEQSKDSKINTNSSIVSKNNLKNQHSIKNGTNKSFNHENSDDSDKTITAHNGTKSTMINNQNGNIEKRNDLIILLPDGSNVTLNVLSNSNADEVYSMLVEKLEMEPKLAQCFYLFEIIDKVFERKLRSTEYPCQLNLINLKNHPNKSITSICMRKWYFNLKCESLLAKDRIGIKYLFHQAVKDVERNQIKIPDDFDLDLNFFKENNRYIEYLKNVYKFNGYGLTIFPHCPCDSRKQGHIILIISSECLKLQACSREGESETQVIEFDFQDVENIETDDEEMALIVEVKIKNKPNRKIKFFSGFYLYMFECIKKAKDELKP